VPKRRGTWPLANSSVVGWKKRGKTVQGPARVGMGRSPPSRSSVKTCLISRGGRDRRKGIANSKNSQECLDKGNRKEKAENGREATRRFRKGDSVFEARVGPRGGFGKKKKRGVAETAGSARTGLSRKKRSSGHLKKKKKKGEARRSTY